MIHNMNLTICTCFTQLLVRDECLLFIKTHILHKFGWEFIERERIFFLFIPRAGCVLESVREKSKNL